MHTPGNRSPWLADTQRADSASGDDGRASPSSPESGGTDDKSRTGDSGDSARGPYERRMQSSETRRYRVVSELARGGLGRILRAEDTLLGRTVAIKELLQSSKLAEALFIREALITARLQHPGIVPVHEAGRWPKGDPFYVMKLVAGKSLQELIREHRTLHERMALLSNVITVVETIAYAHSQGVIHRDIKPANILIGEFGETVVVDWGLARDCNASAPVPDIAELEHIEDMEARAASELSALGAADEPRGSVWLISGNYSISGKVIGTPAYMAPEQARGDVVDERADIYALGALLYELMSGHPPYPGRELSVVIEQLLSGPPKRLVELNPSIPQELITIAEKAMARDPALRYASARELAADLKRFHTGKLVSAHKYTTGQLLRRWLWRHRSPVAVGSAALLLLAAIGAMSVQRVVKERNVARKERHIADAERNTAKAERTVARQAGEQAAERERELLLLQAKSALEPDPTAALAWLKRARLSGPYFDRARAIYDTAMAAGVARHVIAHDSWVLDVAFAPDSKTVFSAGRDGRLKATDPATGASRLILQTDGDGGLSSVAVSPDGNWLMAGRTDSVVELMRLGKGHQEGPMEGDKDKDKAAYEAARQLGPPGTRSAHVIKFSPDSRYALAGLQWLGLRVFEVESGRMLLEMDEVRAAAFRHKAGQILIGKGGDASARPRAAAVLIVMDLATGTELKRIPLPSTPRVIRESPRGGVVAMHLDSQELLLVDLTIGKVRSLGMATLTSSWPETALAFSRDGQYLATTGPRYEVLLWDLATLRPRALHGHSNEILDLDFAPDGSLLVSAGDDGTVRVWDQASNNLKVLRGHRDDVRMSRISPDGAWLASSGLDSTMRLWSLKESTSRMLLRGHSAAPAYATFAGTERVLTLSCHGCVPGRAAGKEQIEIYAWNTRTGQHEVLRRPKEGDVLHAMPFLHGRHVLIGNAEMAALEVWDLAGGSYRMFTPPGMGAGNDVLAATPTLIAMYDRQRKAVRVLSLDSDRVIELSMARPCSAIFSPAGTELVTGGAEGIVLWNLETPGTRRIIAETAMVCDASYAARLQFSQDGAWLALSPTAFKLMLWSRDTGALRTIGLRGNKLSTMAFSPQSSHLAVSGADRRVSVIELATGNERALGQHADFVWSLGWSPDGRLLATASYDQTIGLWDMVSGSYRALLGHSHSVDSIAFSPDSAQLASVSRDRTVRVWDVADDPIASPEILRGLINAGTTAELTEDSDRVRTGSITSGEASLAR